MDLVSKSSKKSSKQSSLSDRAQRSARHDEVANPEHGIDEALAELVDQLPGVSAAMMFDSDGFALSGVARPGGELESEAAEPAAMGANLISAARQALTAGAGSDSAAPVRSIWVRNDRQNLYCVAVGEAAYAVITAEPDVPAGLLMFRIDKWSKLAAQAVDSLSLTIPQQLGGSDSSRSERADRKLVAREVRSDRIGPVRVGQPSDFADRDVESDSDRVEAFEPYVGDDDAPADRAALYAHSAELEVEAPLASENLDLVEAIGIELIAEAETESIDDLQGGIAAEPSAMDEPEIIGLAGGDASADQQVTAAEPLAQFPTQFPTQLPTEWAAPPELASPPAAPELASPVEPREAFSAVNSEAPAQGLPAPGVPAPASYPENPPARAVFDAASVAATPPTGSPRLSDDWVIIETAAAPAPAANFVPEMPSQAPAEPRALADAMGDWLAPAPPASHALMASTAGATGGNAFASPPRGTPVSFDAPPVGFEPVPPAWMSPAPVVGLAVAPPMRQAPAPVGPPVAVAAPSPAQPGPQSSQGPVGYRPMVSRQAPPPMGSPVMLAPPPMRQAPPPMGAPVMVAAPPTAQPSQSPVGYRPMPPRPATAVWSPSAPDGADSDHDQLASWGAYGLPNPSPNAPRP